MREDLRRRLREIGLAHSVRKNGVTGVTPPVTPIENTPLHRPLHLVLNEKEQSVQRCNTVTPVTPSESQIGFPRYTTGGDTGGVTRPATTVLRTEPLPHLEVEDWFAHFEERAAIREFEGGFDRAEAERLALEETISALGQQPGTRH